MSNHYDDLRAFNLYLFAYLFNCLIEASHLILATYSFIYQTVLASINLILFIPQKVIEFH